MKNTPPANAAPKIIALAQGEPVQVIILFIPDFKPAWLNKMKQIPSAKMNIKNEQWIVPYSSETIRQLEQLFGKHILFAFKIDWLIGNHQTDKI
ncbi:MAG: hypothetical protein ACI94Y_002692 [Maribacter sp.]|jgi:hypothetical protein